MTSDVVLTAALRNNLLSLQSTQRNIDITQFRLATGRKINSALDGPQSFFAAQGLNNRASDLTRLLDSIGQSIQVIKAADNGVTALTTLVEQADSIASAARDALAAGQSEAKVTGDRDLSGIDDLDTELAGVTAASQITITVTDPEDSANPTINAQVVAVAGSVESFVTAINDLNIALTDGDAIEAEINDDGNLVIRSLNGGNLRVEFTDIALAQELGFSDQARDVAGNIEFTASAGAVLTSYTFYNSTTTPDEIAQASVDLDDVVDEDGVDLFAATAVDITVNGATLTGVGLAGNSIQSFVDAINASDSPIRELVEAAYDAETGKLTLRALSPEVTSIQFDAGAAAADFGWGASQTDENVVFGAGAEELAQLELDYNRVRDQIDALVQDTGYRGTNLLNGDDLTTTFNEFRTSRLVTNGVTFTADSLGIDEANFSTTATVDGQRDQIRAALEQVRSFGSTLANDLSMIQVRQEFTSNLVNTLTAGADALVNADQNEEGAKLLALQTRQQLGVTSLALASQSQQSILRLF